MPAILHDFSSLAAGAGAPALVDAPRADVRCWTHPVTLRHIVRVWHARGSAVLTALAARVRRVRRAPRHGWRHRWSTCLLLLATLVPPFAARPAVPGAAQPPAVTDTGRSPETFVLLTGLVGGVDGFRRIQRLLVAQGYRVVAIDPYQLSLDSADVTFAALARRVRGVLTERGVTVAHIVGHAHGGGV